MAMTLATGMSWLTCDWVIQGALHAHEVYWCFLLPPAILGCMAATVATADHKVSVTEPCVGHGKLAWSLIVAPCNLGMHGLVSGNRSWGVVVISSKARASRCITWMQGAVYVTGNGAYTWTAAVQETVDATLNRTVSSGKQHKSMPSVFWNTPQFGTCQTRACV